MGIRGVLAYIISRVIEANDDMEMDEPPTLILNDLHVGDPYLL
jgi:hypothetical protein